MLVGLLLLVFGAVRLPYETRLTAEHRAAYFGTVKLNLALREQIGQLFLDERSVIFSADHPGAIGRRQRRNPGERLADQRARSVEESHRNRIALRYQRMAKTRQLPAVAILQGRPAGCRQKLRQ